MKKLLFMLVIASVVFISGCKKDDYQEKIGVCPLVVSTIPIDKAINVPLNQIISATFNEKMNPATITQESFTVQQGATTNAGLKSAMLDVAVAGSVTYNNLTATFTPSSPLLPNTVYTGRVKTAAKDLLNQALQADYVWTFTTIAQVLVSPLPLTGGTIIGAGTFNQESQVTVTATAASGFVFTNWTENGTVVSTNSTYQFAMVGNRVLIANFSQQYRVIISSLPDLGGTTTGAGSFNPGSSVTVTATPNTGYTFVNWTEGINIVSTEATYTSPLNASRTLVANFALNIIGLSLDVVANNGSVLKNPNLLTYANGATVVLTATPNSGYIFTSWSGDATGSVSPLTVTMNSNKNITANFALIGSSLSLDVVANNGSVLKNPNLLTYANGATVVLTATPNSGYVFTSWSGDATGSVSPLTVTMNSNKNITANFALIGSSLSLDVVANNGSVLKNPDLLTYANGATVVLTATPNSGYIFTSWSGDVTGSVSPLTVTMNANKNITANFALIGSGLTLDVIANNGSVLKNPNLLTYANGATVQLTATPNSGFKFTSWSGDATGSVSPLTVTMNANKNITANFTADIINPGSPAGIDLGSAGNFAILAGSGVSNTGVTTHIIGDVGAFPTATMNGLLAGNVDGILYTAADPIVGLAKTALTTAYNDAQSRSLNAVSLPGQLGGLTLAPGLYVNSSTSGISGTGANGILTLDAGGDANAVWIFKMGSTFVTDAGTSIVLAGGAQAKNIYWSVGTSATLGTNSIFYGNILADQAITLTTGATLYGRALTRIAAVTLDSSTITKP